MKRQPEPICVRIAANAIDYWISKECDRAEVYPDFDEMVKSMDKAKVDLVVMAAELSILRAENEMLRAENETLRAALKPFAEQPVFEWSSCHAGITVPEMCGRCAPILAARAVLNKETT